MQIPIFNINENLYIGYSNIIPENNYRLDVNGDINLTGSLRQNNILFSSYSDNNVLLLLNNGINSNIETSGNIIGDGSQLTNLNANNISSGVLSITKGGTGATDAATARTNLNVDVAGTINYILPVPTSSELGGVKADGTTILINSDGVISGAAQYGDDEVKTLLNTGIDTNIETSGNIIGDGSQLTNLNANNIVSGKISNNRLPNDITISGTLTASNLNVNGETTIINTNTYETENLEINSENADGPSLKIVHNSDIENIIEIEKSNEILYKITQDGKIGIGTTNPTGKLDVVGELKIRGTNRNSHICYSDGNTYIRGSTNSGYVLLNDNGGNVGIGTTNPSYKLDVNGLARIDNCFVGRGYDNYDYCQFRHQSLTSHDDYALLQWTGGQTFLNAKSGQVIDFRIGNQQKMRLDSNGNVGIGTNNPRHKLDVYGGHLGVRSTNEHSDSVIYIGAPFDSNSAYKGAIYFDANATGQGWSTGTLHICNRDAYNDNSTMVSVSDARISIKPNGNVGIGTINPNSKLDVNGDIRLSGNILNSSGEAWTPSGGTNENIVYITKTITTINKSSYDYPENYFYIDDVQYYMEDIPEILNSNENIIKYLVENNKIIIDINNLKTYNNNNILQKRLKINYNLHRDMSTYYYWFASRSMNASDLYYFGIGTTFSNIYIDFYSDPNYNSGNWYFSVRYKTTKDSLLLARSKLLNQSAYNTLPLSYSENKTVGKFGKNNSSNIVYYKLNVTETENWYIDYDNSQGGKTVIGNNYTPVPKEHNNKFNNGTEIYYTRIGDTGEFNLLFKFVNNKLIISMIPYLGEYSIIIKGV